MNPKLKQYLKSYNYRDWLKDEVASKQLSLRKLAAGMDVSVSYISRILQGERDLNAKHVPVIGRLLAWSPSEIYLFSLLVSYSTLKSEDEKKDIANQIDQHFDYTEFETLSYEKFCILADWYHGALLELMKTKDFKAKPGDIAKRLGITPMQAELAIDRLILTKLIKKTPQGGLVRTSENLKIPAQVSLAIRKYQKQILSMALKAIDHQQFEERDHSSVVFAMNPDKVPAARELIQEFRARMNALAKESNDKSEVYALSIQMFRLTSKFPDTNS